MKIKRIFASDMRQAIRKVRDELGPDAVILSSRNVEGGVEVVSAVDYDERVIQAAAPEPAPREPQRPAAFADLLSKMQPKPAPQTRGRRNIDISVDDDVDLGFAMPEPEPAPAPVRAEKPAPSIEWTQEPAIQEMRQELKMLRSLFENQLTMMEWQQASQRQPVRATLLKQLNELGLGADVCRKLADHIDDESDPERAFERALALLAKHMPVTDDDILDRGGIVAVVGPTGVGKTTTVAKLAARFALRHGRGSVALVTTDNFRIGAQDQLRNFGRILGVPVHTAGSREELEAVLGDLSDKRLVLIDTAGMSQRDMRLSEQFQTLANIKLPIRSYLVMSANTQLAALSESVRAFKSIRPVACILTKLDEATSLGGAITAVLRHKLPIAYLGVGQRVPEDLQPGRADRLVEQARGLAAQYRQETDDETLALTFGAAGGK
jgi:flagellar biosynthesis protein FlhF